MQGCRYKMQSYNMTHTIWLIFYSSIFNESESISCSMQLISCLILIASDCVWDIFCRVIWPWLIWPWLIWPWLIWPWLIWLTSVWLIFGYVIMEWLEVVWLIRTAVTSGCEWSGLLLSWFPKLFWPSFDGNELGVVQIRSIEVISGLGQTRSGSRIFDCSWTRSNFVTMDCQAIGWMRSNKVRKGQIRSNEVEPLTLVKLFSNFLRKYSIQFFLRIFVTIHKMLWNQNDRWMLRFPSLSPKL